MHIIDTASKNGLKMAFIRKSSIRKYSRLGLILGAFVFVLSINLAHADNGGGNSQGGGGNNQGGGGGNRGAPGPIAGAGFPALLAIGGLGYWAFRRSRQKAE